MKQAFVDLERYQEAAQGWGLEFVQLDRGPLRASLQLARDRHVSVLQTRLNRQFHQQGQSPAFGRTFAFRLRALGPVRWMGRDFGDNALAVFPEDRAFEATSWPGFDVLTVTVDEAFLATIADTYGLWHVLDHLPRGGAAYACDPAILRRLRAACLACLEAGAQAQRVGSTFELQATVAELALTALSRRSVELAPPRPRKRDVAFSMAIEAIRQMPPDAVTIPDLCRTVGASERTLRYAFRERCGVAPKAYINAFRLNRVRATLLSASRGQQKVQDIAARWGFWHLSQFSHDYRRLFGERPSETLDRPV